MLRRVGINDQLVDKIGIPQGKGITGKLKVIPPADSQGLKLLINFLILRNNLCPASRTTYNTFSHGLYHNAFFPYRQGIIEIFAFAVYHTVSMRNIADRQGYLERIAKPLQEKLKITGYIPDTAKTILDVGCADGTLTLAMAGFFPKVRFLGVDLDGRFIEEAEAKSRGVNNVRFEKVYLRDLLARPERFDAVVFSSVLHEFFTYGEGISSVLKALADAHELLTPGGLIIIRDMILREYTKGATLEREDIIAKINKENLRPYIADFEKEFGKLDSVYKINHFLLKYWYTENWEREGKENYIPVTFERYEQIFALLGMTVQFQQSYLIDFLKDKWKKDFSLTDWEIAEFKSTGLIITQKK